MKAHIKSTELRIGNRYLVHLEESDRIMIADADTIKIQSEYDENPNAEQFSRGWDCFPIPLDEQWLLKAGFRKFSSTQYDHDDFWTIQFQERGSYQGYFRCPHLEIHLPFVHTLQNVFFALTGEEPLNFEP